MIGSTFFGLENGRPQVRVFDDGTKKWKVVYTAPVKPYCQCVITWYKDTCYYHLIESPENKKDDCVPMRVVSLHLKAR